MQPDELKRLYVQHKVTGSGPITASEAMCMLRAIEEHRPLGFVEVGTSSGLSTGLLARMLHDNGGERLVSVDVSDRFYRDESRPSGFLVPDIYDGDRVSVELFSPATTLDMAARDDTFEMGFVDGSHQHPWPTIDTLCLLPKLGGSKILFHHDLNLYKKQKNAHGVGGKYLFDQVPEANRTRYAAHGGNLFSLLLDLPLDQIESIAAESFALPWTGLRWKGSRPTLDTFRGVLRQHYSADLLAVFDESAERYAAAGKRKGKQSS